MTMLNICDNCGEYRADKIIDVSGPYAVCPACQHQHPFHQLPLFMICGPSGTGKSTICSYLMGKLDEMILLDADLLWRPEFNKPDDQYRDFFETWLRLGKNMSQSGRPLALFCAGGIPDNIEPCVERRYYSTMHYLALVADDATLRERLQRRPAWRKTRDDSFVAAQIAFNQWFRQRANDINPKITLLDTTNDSIDTTAKKVRGWLLEAL